MMQLPQSTLNFICAQSEADVRTLALQAHKYPEVDMPAAIVQIAGRQSAMGKIPSWHATDGLWYPRHLSLEQCSSELTARYKASLVEGESLAEDELPTQGESFADLTGGFGIDCAFLSTRFRQATYVERQEELCEIAAHNFPLLGLPHINIHHADGVEYLQKMSPVDCLFIDPARRNEHGGKTVALSDCEPDVAALEELLLIKARQVIIKLSPMLDLTLALRDMPHTREAHIISVNNECKELVLILSQETEKAKSHPSIESGSAITIHCVNLTPKGNQRFVFTRKQEQEADCTYTDVLGTYLYEPNASLLKAGAYRCLASIYKVKKLHPNSHLYTSDTPIDGFPGRAFHITAVCTFNKKEIKESLSDIKQANITVRNFPASVAELRKRTKLTEGGDNYLFATTLSDEQKVLIRCTKP